MTRIIMYEKKHEEADFRNITKMLFVKYVKILLSIAQNYLIILKKDYARKDIILHT